MMRVGGLPRLDHLHIVCRQIVERVVGVVVLLLAVLSPVVATFGQLQVHHLSVMVMMHSHCYHCEHNGKAGYDYGQSFVHSAAKVKIFFHIYKYYKLFFYEKMFVLYRLCAAMPPTARVVCRNKAAASGGPPLREAAVREVRCPGGPLSGRSLSGRSAALSGQADINVCFLGCDAQWEVAFAFFARDMDPRTACFARLRGAEYDPTTTPPPRLRYACPGLERGRLFEAIAAHSRVWTLRSLRLCER